MGWALALAWPCPAHLASLPREGPGPSLGRVAMGRGRGTWATVAVLKGTPCAAHLSEHLNFPSLYDRPIQLLPGSVSI